MASALIGPAPKPAWLFFTVGLLVILGLAVEIWWNYFPSPAAESWVRLFSLSYEENVPNWYASCLLFWCGLYLAKIYSRVGGKRESFRWHWAALAIGFFYMSLDEAVGIHESLSGITGAGGILYYDWILPAGLLVLVLAAVYWPFLRQLRPSLRRRFLLAAVLYIGGAVVMEAPLGYWASRFGEDNFGYAVLDLIEETLELLGATLFLTSLAEELEPATEQAVL